MSGIIKIDWLEDEFDCEQCGGSYAYGAVITFPDNSKLNLEPVAHCYGGTTYEDREVYRKIIEHLGFKVEERDV